MKTLLELFENVDSDYAARVLPTLFTWPHTETVSDIDSASLKIVQDRLHLGGASTDADTDVELHATGRRDTVTLLHMLDAYKHCLLMLKNVDNILLYQNGKLAVRIRLNETQNRRSAAIDVLQVRTALEKRLENTQSKIIDSLMMGAIIGVTLYIFYGYTK